MQRTTAALLAATGVVAVHATADSFVAPERGTAWDGRLVPGFATLAVLAVAALVFVRARDGLRAAAALALGALAGEGFVLAVLDARAVAARGDDWTGFLLAPAAAVLLATGVVLLARSRRPGGRRALRRAGLAVAGVVGGYWLVLPVGMALLATHRPRQPVAPAALGRPYERVSLRTADGLRLAAWYVPSRNGAAVVSYPTRSGALPEARLLARHGYGVLLLDARGYDGSEGAPNRFGWVGDRDVDAAVAWLRRRPDVRNGRVGGIGFSVGGEVLLQAAAANPALRAVVAEGAGIRSVREELLYGWRSAPTLPLAAVQTASVALLSGDRPPPSLRDLVGRIAPRPVLFVEAEHGSGGEDLDRRYRAAAGPTARLWVVPGAGHTGGYEADPRGYERRVVGFFDRALGRLS